MLTYLNQPECLKGDHVQWATELVERYPFFGIGQCLHVRHLLSRSKFDWLNPSDAILVVTGITRGNKAVIIIAAAIHQRPAAHAVIAAIAGVVHIRQTQTVGELVADGTDALNQEFVPVFIAFVGHSIGIDPDAVSDFKIHPILSC